MAKAQRAGVLLLGVLLWTGLGQVGSQAPAVGSQTVVQRPPWRAEIPARDESQEICSQVGQPMTVLFVAPPGQAVKKGDLLVELDASPLIEKRTQQMLDTTKAESDLVLAKDALEMDQRAAGGQMVLAEKALRLAQAQLTAFTEGEYPTQLAETQAEVALAQQRSLMTRDRYDHLRAASRQGNQDPQAETELQEAQLASQEASAQSAVAQNKLALLQKSVHDNRIAELELAVAQKDYDLARAKDALSSAVLRDKQAVALAEMTHRTESARLARLDNQIAQAKIYAPRDGTVVYPADVDEAATKPGATIYDRQVLLRLRTATPPQ